MYKVYIFAFKFKGVVVHSFKYFKEQQVLVFYNLASEVVYTEYIPFEIYNYLYYHKDRQIEFEAIASDYGEELLYYKCKCEQGAV